MAEYGLVLSSDGSKNSFEIGAWKALRELDINITAVSGSFVGALNAALIAQGDFEKAIRFWRNVSSKNLFGVNKIIARKYTEEWSKNDTKIFKRSFLKYIQGHTEELDPLKETLDVYIDEKVIRRSQIKLGFVSVSLNTLEAEMLTIDDIPRGRLSTYLLTATCFPQISQVNRAKDPQFSTQYSPYLIIEKFGNTQIISTDDIIAVPPQLNADITLIQSSEALVLDLCESAEMMKKHIKLGYIDTLRHFEESLSSTYYITNDITSEQFLILKDQFGKRFKNHLDDLLRILLKVKNTSRESIEIRIKQMLKIIGIESDDIYIAIIENLAKLLNVPKEEKYNLEKILAVIQQKIIKHIQANKDLLSDPIYVRDLLKNVAEPERIVPSSEILMQYFLLLISCKPSSYRKLVPFIDRLNIKTILAIVTMIYMIY